MVLHYEHLIGGHFFGGPCDTTAAKQVVFNPYSGSVVGTAAEGDWPEADAALEAAQRAFDSWRLSDVSTRKSLLLNIAQLIEERSDELAELMALEIGKPIRQARGEVQRAIVTTLLSAEQCSRAEPIAADLGPDKRADQYEAHVRRIPRGVVYCITPWNWPINLAMHKVGPALAAGNTVVLKGSGLSSLSSLALGRLIHDAGCPPGVLNVINVPNATAARMVEDPRVSMISFTGSPKVGWGIKQKAWRLPVALELGGNAYAIVNADCDIEQAARALASSAFSYAGQICISTQNIRVHAAVYDAFRSEFLRAVGELKLGDPTNEQTDVGPLITTAEADRIAEWCEEAVYAGAQWHKFGERQGSLFPLSVIESAPTECRIVKEEAFGPVVTLNKVDSLSQAIEEIRASQFGIHASLFTRSAASEQEFLQQVPSGGLILNDAPTVRFDALPYGGIKQSGFGREGVVYAFEEMSEPQSIIRKRLK